MSNQTTAKSSGLCPAGATVVKASASRLNSVSLVSDGTNAATCIVYDNTAGSGLALAQVSAPIAGSANISFVNPIRAEIGLTVVVVGGTGSAVISYDA